MALPVSRPCRHADESAATDQPVQGVLNRADAASAQPVTPAITLALYTHPTAERDREAAEHFGKLIERES